MLARLFPCIVLQYFAVFITKYRNKKNHCCEMSGIFLKSNGTMKPQIFFYLCLLLKITSGDYTNSEKYSVLFLKLFSFSFLKVHF